VCTCPVYAGCSMLGYFLAGVGGGGGGEACGGPLGGEGRWLLLASLSLSGGVIIFPLDFSFSDIFYILLE
jgi:hypothetical protein